MNSRISIPIHTYMYIAIINENEAMNLKNNKEGYMGRFGGRKAKM